MASIPIRPPRATSQPQQGPNLCEHCQIQPKFVEGHRTHPYCGKTCAAAAKTKRTASRHQNNDPVGSGPSSPGIADRLCLLTGCQNSAYRYGDFCSKSHLQIATEGCLLCLKIPKQVGCYCSKECANEAQRKGPTILDVPSTHVLFKSVADQFKESWRHKKKICPTVRHVYKVVETQESISNYETYRNAVETRGHFRNKGRSPGNENRRWHGTQRDCALGDNGHTELCSSSSCSLCCIIRTSFDVTFVKKATGWGRFGAGIYTSSTSSKSDDYSKNKCQSDLKAVLLNKVVVGKGCKLTKDNANLTAPPKGYDSVLGEKGEILNHDEVIVYTNDAIRPSYLVLYDA